MSGDRMVSLRTQQGRIVRCPGFPGAGSDKDDLYVIRSGFHQLRSRTPKRTRTRVSVKLFNPKRCREAEPVSRREAELLLELRGAENVVRCLGHVESPRPAIVMELLGQPRSAGLRGHARVGDWLKNRKGKVDLLRQLLRGVKAIHKKGIVHRDIRMDNILVQYKSRDGDENNNSPGEDSKNQGIVYKISNFDRACRLPLSKQTRPLPPSSSSSPCHLAPELLCPAGVPSYSERVDVWAVGFLLYDLESIWFDFNDDLELFRRCMSAEGFLGQVIRRALTADKNKRPSAQALATALKALR